MNELTSDEQGMLVDAIHDSATVIHKGQRMNKRITELMLEAGKTIPGDKHIDADFCEKFAELIVAECLEACSRANEIRHFVPPTQEQVVLSCMREIENTFRS